jgi:hypothetical protein
MVPADVYTTIRRQCDETDTTFWGESETYGLMSVAEGIIAQKIGLIESVQTTTSVTGTRAYTAPAGTIIRATYDEVKLKQIDFNEVDNVEGEAYGGITSQGTPEYYYMWGNQMHLSPIPNAAKAVKSYFYGYPDVVTTASTTWTIPNEYGHHTVNYALWRMMLKDQEMSAEAAAYERAWNSSIVEIQSDWNSRKFRDRYATVNVFDPIETCE